MTDNYKPVIDAAKNWAEVRRDWLFRGDDTLREKLTAAEMRPRNTSGREAREDDVMRKPASGTVVYGTSDDLIEVDGEFVGEVGYYGKDDRKNGVLVVISDGTLLEVKYGKNGDDIWEVKLVKKGELFLRIDQCDSSDADPYSDVAWFSPGIKWAYAATEWQKVQ